MYLRHIQSDTNGSINIIMHILVLPGRSKKVANDVSLTPNCSIKVTIFNGWSVIFDVQLHSHGNLCRKIKAITDLRVI